jgi:anti-sigma factor RsiW
VTCAEYQDLVAADVDGVLGAEAETVKRHLAGCESCRRLRERQLMVRDLLRSRPLQQSAPHALRTRVLARLEEESERVVTRKWRSWAPWIGFALACATAVAVMTLWTRDNSFAPLIKSYDLAARGALQITFPTSEPAVLEGYYREHQTEGFPEHVVDLSHAGFRLVGGAVRDFSTRKARLSVYSNGKDIIVCDYQFAEHFPFVLPASGKATFFSQRGVNFCARRMGNEVCLLASRMAMERFRTLVGDSTAG